MTVAALGRVNTEIFLTNNYSIWKSALQVESHVCDGGIICAYERRMKIDGLLRGFDQKIKEQ